MWMKSHIKQNSFSSVTSVRNTGIPTNYVDIDIDRTLDRHAYTNLHTKHLLTHQKPVVKNTKLCVYFLCLQ